MKTPLKTSLPTKERKPGVLLRPDGKPAATLQDRIIILEEHVKNLQIQVANLQRRSRF